MDETGSMGGAPAFAPKTMTQRVRIGLLIGGFLMVQPWSITQHSSSREFIYTAPHATYVGWPDMLQLTILALCLLFVFLRKQWLVAVLMGATVIAILAIPHVTHVLVSELYLPLLGAAVRSVPGLLLVAELAAAYSGRVRTMALIVAVVGGAAARMFIGWTRPSLWPELDFPPMPLTALVALAGCAMMAIGAWATSGKERLSGPFRWGFPIAFFALLTVTELLYSAFAAFRVPFSWPLSSGNTTLLTLCIVLCFLFAGPAARWRFKLTLGSGIALAVTAGLVAVGLLRNDITYALLSYIPYGLQALAPACFAVMASANRARFSAVLGLCLAAVANDTIGFVHLVARRSLFHRDFSVSRVPIRYEPDLRLTFGVLFAMSIFALLITIAMRRDIETEADS